MNSGLSENFPDRVSPIKAHVDGLRGLGADTGPLNPHINAVTSDVVRVCLLGYIDSLPDYTCQCFTLYHSK